MRRLSRAIEAGRGIRLSAADVDLLVEHGGYDALSRASAEIQREQARERLEQRAATRRPECPPPTDDSEAAAAAALARAREMTRSRRR